jgi:hypothetical protein
LFIQKHGQSNQRSPPEENCETGKKKKDVDNQGMDFYRFAPQPCGNDFDPKMLAGSDDGAGPEIHQGYKRISARLIEPNVSKAKKVPHHHSGKC